jgi:hypothetical protein
MLSIARRLSGVGGAFSELVVRTMYDQLDGQVCRCSRSYRISQFGKFFVDYSSVLRQNDPTSPSNRDWRSPTAANRVSALESDSERRGNCARRVPPTRLCLFVSISYQSESAFVIITLATQLPLDRWQGDLLIRLPVRSGRPVPLTLLFASNTRSNVSSRSSFLLMLFNNTQVKFVDKTLFPSQGNNMYVRIHVST